MNWSFDLNGKAALVTGAGQGLGRAVALRLAKAGALVAVNDIHPRTAQSVSREIADAGGQAVPVPCDASDESAIREMFAQIIDKAGRLDILVNNAGIVTPDDIFGIDLSIWEKVLKVNLTGPFLCSKEALMHMKARASGGRIVMVGSVVGHQGAIRGWPHYGATKSGIHGLAKTLARAGAALGVTVNAVAPGVIRTEMLEKGHESEGMAALATQVPLGCLGDPEDVAAAVHYLCSDGARYVTGSIIDVNGGLYIRA